MVSARRVSINTKYKGTDISTEIAEYIESFSYDDAASGESDTISLSLRDDKKKWISSWFPEKGDSVECALVFKNWDYSGTSTKLKCGKFQVDDISFQGGPLSVTIGATSTPQGSAFNVTERTKTWESITVEQIAKEIAKRASVSLYYDADKISISSIEQSGQTDCKFLYSICQSYGLAMKVYSNKIVIIDEEKAEKEKATLTLKENDIISWSFNTTVAGTYTAAKVSFSDPDNDKDYVVKIGSGERVLTVNVTADSLKDAERKGIAKLNSENKKTSTMSVTIKANPSIVSGINVNIDGLGKIDGKYYIDKVRTKVSGSGATQMSLTLHKVNAYIKNITKVTSKSTK